MLNSTFNKFENGGCAQANNSNRTKFIARVLAVFMLIFCATLVLSSCSGGANSSNENSGGTNVENSNNASSNANSNNSNANKNASATSNSNSNANSSSSSTTANKSLVVYFSWSGNTRAVAQEVQKQTNSDIFEIVPVQAYSSDYNETVDLAKEEQQKNARPEFSGSIDNLDDYGTVYVGFPNWWGDMPMILYTFFEKYDLSGKNVALFCTSGGSGLSDTVSEVKSLQPSARVLEGLHVSEADSSSSASAVSSWLSNIGTK